MSTEQENDLTPEVEDAPEHDQHSKMVPVIRSIGVVLALTAVIVCSYLLFNLFKDTLEPPETDKPVVQETSAPVSTAGQISETMPEAPIETKPSAEQKASQKPIPLPDLNKSDEEVRSAAITLNPSEEWVGWVTTEEALRKFVVVVDNLAAGKIAQKYLPMPKPDTKFRSTLDGINYYLDPTSFERYTPYVRLFKNIDTDMTVNVYQHYSPLLEEAFAELGYGERSFHDTLLQAFDVLLQAPVIKGNIELIRPSVYFKYLDPALENSSAVHKQMIRMGPQNTQDLQFKIQELKTALSKANEQG